jgi:hypothetical protein
MMIKDTPLNKLAKEKLKTLKKKKEKKRLSSTLDTHEYIDTQTLKKKYKNEEEVVASFLDMKNELIAEKNIYTLSHLLERRGIPRRKFYDWSERYPLAGEIHDNILNILGDRLLANAIKDTRTIHHLMPYYDPYVWKKMVAYHSDLKKSEQSETQKVGIVLPCYNSCCVKVKDE